MRNDNVLKENVTQVSGKLQKSVIEVQQKYGDILNLPHHVSETHPPMPIADRAAQFAPFAALTGYIDGNEVERKSSDEEPFAALALEYDARTRS